jgi:hypothetical protein
MHRASQQKATTNKCPAEAGPAQINALKMGNGRRTFKVANRSAFSLFRRFST